MESPKLAPTLISSFRCSQHPITAQSSTHLFTAHSLCYKRIQPPWRPAFSTLFKEFFLKKAEAHKAISHPDGPNYFCHWVEPHKKLVTLDLNFSYDLHSEPEKAWIIQYKHRTQVPDLPCRELPERKTNRYHNWVMQLLCYRAYILKATWLFGFALFISFIPWG